jgi:hypothetical protein
LKLPPRTALFVLLLFTYKISIDLLASQAKQVNTSICATSKVFSPRPGSGNFKRSCSLSLCAAKTSLVKIAYGTGERRPCCVACCFSSNRFGAESSRTDRVDISVYQSVHELSYTQKDADASSPLATKNSSR